MREIEYKVNQLVARHRGALPVILTSPHGIDAIQVKIESKLRIDQKKRDAFIEDLAHAISSLMSRYANTQTMSAYRSANFLPRLQA